MRYLLTFLLSILSFSLHAEIHREAILCKESGEMCFYWWPKLPEVDGWQQDVGNSYEFSSNTQAPVGFSFSNAESVIYAKAVYKLRQPESKNLDEFIANDKKRFLLKKPDLIIKESPVLTASNGMKFRSFSFAPKTAGDWEHVSYSEEKDKDGNEYYLVFVLSSRNEQGYKTNMSSYEKFIKFYK